MTTAPRFAMQKMYFETVQRHLAILTDAMMGLEVEGSS